MKRILGLDASTTTIGVSVVDYDSKKKELVHAEFFKPPKKEDLFERLSQVRHYIFNLCKVFRPDDVALEDIILFMQGKSNATTITSLAVLNRTVGLAIYEELGKPPHLLNVVNIRHTIKKDKYPQKEEVPELVADHLGIQFPYTYNKKGAKMVENYDVADGIAVALAFIMQNSVKKKPKKLSTRKVK